MFSLPSSFGWLYICSVKWICFSHLSHHPHLHLKGGQVYVGSWLQPVVGWQHDRMTWPRSMAKEKLPVAWQWGSRESQGRSSWRRQTLQATFPVTLLLGQIQHPNSKSSWSSHLSGVPPVITWGFWGASRCKPCMYTYICVCIQEIHVCIYALLVCVCSTEEWCSLCVTGACIYHWLFSIHLFFCPFLSSFPMVPPSPTPTVCVWFPIIFFYLYFRFLI